MFGWFDPLYLLIVGPAMLLGMYAQAKVKSTFAEAQRLPACRGLTGAEAAAAILKSSGVEGVKVELADGFLSDHYDPRDRTLRLSEDVYHGRNLAALGVAAHEAGHALQHRHGDFMLRLRNSIVPFASIGGSLSWILFIAGFALASAKLFLVGVALFGLTVLFQLVNLPVEFDASRRARRELLELGITNATQDQEVGRVLSAAALTYVAATLSALLTLLYYVFMYLGQFRGEEES